MAYPDYKKGLKAGCIGGLAACILAMIVSVGFATQRLSLHQPVGEQFEETSINDSLTLFKNLPPGFLLKRAILVFFIIGLPIGIAAAFRPDTSSNKQRLAAAKAELEKLAINQQSD